MFGLSLPWKIVIASVALAAAVAWGWNHGKNVERARQAAATIEEIERQGEANVEAQRETAARIAEIERLRRERDTALLALAAAAAADPDGATCGLPLGGVLRHNQFTAPAAP